MRYPSAKEMADDLRRFLEDRPIRARRASSAEQAFRWCRRNPAVASLLTAVLLVFAAGAVVAGYFAVRAEAQRQRAEDREQEANEARKLADRAADEVRTKELLTRQLLYDSQMNHESTLLNEGKTPRVKEILGETTPKSGEPDLRGWEWHYLDRLLHGEYRTVDLQGKIPDLKYRSPYHIALNSWNSDTDQHCALSGKAPRLVGLRNDGEGFRMDVWDAPTGRLVNQLPRSGQPALVTALQVEMNRPARSGGRSNQFGGGPSPPQRTTPVLILSPDGGQLVPGSRTTHTERTTQRPPRNLRVDCGSGTWRPGRSWPPLTLARPSTAIIVKE